MEGIEIYLDITRFIVGIVILGYASYTDIKTRRASNLNWLIMGSAGAILLVIQHFTVGFNGQEMYLLFIPIMIGLVYLLFQMRLIFGGADAKALMALAILVPITPSIILFQTELRVVLPFSWSVFSLLLRSFCFKLN